MVVFILALVGILLSFVFSCEYQPGKKFMITLILTLIQLAASLVLIVLQLIALEDQKVSAAESL